jgi:hypothetical protein
MSHQWARWLIRIGVTLTALGVFLFYELQLHGIDWADSRKYDFLYATFRPTLLIGLVATLAGSVTWAWRAPLLRLAVYGAVLAALPFLAGYYTPINIHGWTVSLAFSYVTTFFIGVLFLVFASARFIYSRLAAKRKQG